MPRKSKKRGKGKGKGKNKVNTPEKKEVKKQEVIIDPNDPKALFARFNIQLGPKGYVSASATTPKSVFIPEFKMMDPGGGRVLLDPTDLKVVEGMKYGLVGKNGYGKTTLLRHMVNYEIEGFPRHIRMLIVQQEQPRDEQKVIDAVLKADIFRVKLEQETMRMEDLVATCEGDEAEYANKALELLYEEQENLNFDQGEKEAQTILDGLGFSKEQKDSRVCDLSGGWRMRVALAKALFCQPDLLLLDEPTNHLDFPTVLWLQQYLKHYKKSVIVVSHDRTFLNNVVTHIIHLHNKQLTYYKGNYAGFITLREQALNAERSNYAKYQLKIRTLKEFIAKTQNDAARELGQSQFKKESGAGTNARAKGNTTSSRVQKERDLEKLLEECPPEPKEEKKMLFQFPEIGLLGEKICEMKDITFGYTEEKILLRNISLHLNETDRVAMIGANGVGKTTLVNLITGKLQPLEGDMQTSRRCRFSLFTQHHVDQLDLELSATDFILREFADDESLVNDRDRVQTVRRRLGRFHITGQQQTQKMKFLSGGQKSRVAFAVATWKKPHFIIMDEPTNHLDIETIDILIHAIRSFHGGVLLISHDQHFLRNTATEFWAVTPDEIKVFNTFEESKTFALRRLLPSTVRPKVKKPRVRSPKAETPVKEPEEEVQSKEEAEDRRRHRRKKPEEEEDEEDERRRRHRRRKKREEEEGSDDDEEEERRKRHRRRKKREEEEEDGDDEEEERRRRRRRRKKREEEEEEEEEPRGRHRRRKKGEEDASEEEDEEERRRRHRRRKKREEEDDEEDDEERRRRHRRRKKREEEEEEDDDEERERRRRHRRRKKREEEEEEEEDRPRRRNRRKKREEEEEEEDEDEEKERRRRRRRKKREEEAEEEDSEEERRRRRRRRRKKQEEDGDDVEETAV